MSDAKDLANIGTLSKVRGVRVQMLRGLTGLSRRVFRERYGIPSPSMENWELGKGNGLSEKGARKLIALLKPDGIHCTFEWLMHGIGPGPTVLSNSYFGRLLKPSDQQEVTASAFNNENQLEMIMEELLVFQQHYPKVAVDFVVTDDGMEPRFIKGEYVAGPKYNSDAMEKLIGLDCIIHTKEGDVLLRTLKQGDLPGRYNLVCRNLNAKVGKPILYNVEILSAAPVIWARRMAPLL
jgi:DNA-binding transcriptional regulator YiaG